MRCVHGCVYWHVLGSSESVCHLVASDWPRWSHTYTLTDVIIIVHNTIMMHYISTWGKADRKKVEYIYSGTNLIYYNLCPIILCATMLYIG